jgi:transposase
MFHKSKKVIETLTKYDIDYQYIVPYHPENNPIERLFSQLKSYLKSSNFQSFDEIKNGIDTIIKSNIKNNNLKNYIETLYDA